MTDTPHTAVRSEDGTHWIVTLEDGTSSSVHAETAEDAIAAAVEVAEFASKAEKRRTAADYATLTQAHIDGVALSLGYRNGDAVASFVVSSVPAWAAEAERFVRWRDAVWMAAYEAQEAGAAHEEFMAALVQAGKDRPT